MEQKKKHVAILGSTGSIGTQALEVIKTNPDHFQLEVITANTSVDILIQQAIDFQPNAVVIVDETKYQHIKESLSSYDIKVFAGEDSLSQVVEFDTIDIVLMALVGYSGLKPTLKAIEAGKPIALANKETMVVAGELVTSLAREKGVNIYPVDSEHSAIFQCIVGEEHNPIEKIYLTASGGPFRGKDIEFLKTVTKEMALQHPNWDMGDKITIDSATLMNKGLEVIEAKWLFGLNKDQIDVVVHPQSIIHSFVQFEDGSMKAQLGLPDMRLPIQYALTYPKRLKMKFERLNFNDFNKFTFEQPDLKTFRNLALSYEALELGGNMPCVLNAANEIAVEAFLNDEITFIEIPVVIEHCLEKAEHIRNPQYEDYVSTNDIGRRNALDYIQENLLVK